MMAAERTPGRLIASVTWKKVFQRGAPSESAASSSRGLMFWMVPSKVSATSEHGGVQGRPSTTISSAPSGLDAGMPISRLRPASGFNGPKVMAMA